MTRTRAEHESRLGEERRRAERGKNLVVLMLHHLANAGYAGSVEALQSESGVSLGQYEVADNIDLISALQEWEDFYELRFGRRAKLVRKLSKFSDEVHGAVPGLPRIGPSAGDAGSGRRRRATVPTPASSSSSAPPTAGGGDGQAAGGPVAGRRARPQVPSAGGKENGAQGPRADPGEGGATDRASDLGLGVTGVAHGVAHGGKSRSSDPEDDEPSHWENRLRKAGLPPAMAANAELRELAGWLQRDMIQHNPNVRWDDIAELDEVKRVLKESLVMPLRYPEYFTGLLQPWKGVLLYGPPGTGKTMLAKAVATECNTTFFNIAASSIVSKWRGDSEKLVRVLFDLARHHAPATIFIDEIDALMGQRGDAGEHEGSRRMKTELLTQMDGLLQGKEQVFLLAATNLPWELDMALLRRLEKRVLVPYPTSSARLDIISRLLPKDKLAPAGGGDGGWTGAAGGLRVLSERTEGYSGSDLVLVCKEAAMKPLRRLLSTLQALELKSRSAERPPQPGPVTDDDLVSALSAVKPTVHAHASRYEAWADEFGSV